MRRIGTMIAAAVVAGCASSSNGTEVKVCATPFDAQTAFAKMKLLAGRWNAQVAAPPATADTSAAPAAPAASDAPTAPAAPTASDAPAVPTTPATPDIKPDALLVEYAVTSGGHTVQEKLFAGSDHEMVTMYYLEGEGLALVHYCAMGNRPHMRLDVAHSTKDDFHFEWDATATDIDPKRDAHIHNGRVHFVDADTIECEWAFWADGKEAARHEFTLSRGNGGFTPLTK
jgi:hypothetical protein